MSLFQKTIQLRIAEKVEESFRLRQKSEQLLDNAKRAVEKAIEQNGSKAMEFIEKQV